MTRTIFAYLDPGSSSMILQMLLGGLAAAGVALKLYWSRFLRLLRIRRDDPVDSAPVSETSSNGTAPADADAGTGPAVGSGRAQR